MKKKELTIEELNDLWAKIDTLWIQTAPHIEGKWVEARFKLNIFKITLSQLGAKLPPGLD